VATGGDAADDPCIYINQDDATKSLVLGTDKKAGLSVYDLSGSRLQFFPGRMNNVDIRYGFSLGNRLIPLIGASDVSTNSIDFFSVDQQSNRVRQLAVKNNASVRGTYGICMYKSPISQKMYVFVTTRQGDVVQWEVIGNEDNTLSLTKVRAFDVGSKVEGCVADDELGKFYVSEEDVGIWQYGAEPTDLSSRKRIDSTDENGHLVPDAEGLALYRLDNGEGYLLASSQGENAFNIYNRKTGEFIGKFRIEYEGNSIEDTDGIDATSQSLGSSFPFGMLVVQDGNKVNYRQSFKYVRWEDLSLKYWPPLEVGHNDSIIEH
jgi:3-phytase